jgi:hypothetical protein
MTDQPGFDAQHLTRGLSLARRVGYAVAGLGGLTVATLVAVLWMTEDVALPPRTQLGFTAIIAGGLAWAGFAGWALMRRPLFAVDRVVTAWLAVAFSAATSAGMLAVAVARAGITGVLAAGAVTGVLLGAAGLALYRARRYRAMVLARHRRFDTGQR